jgi:hypothetical protein
MAGRLVLLRMERPLPHGVRKAQVTEFSLSQKQHRSLTKKLRSHHHKPKSFSSFKHTG